MNKSRRQPPVTAPGKANYWIEKIEYLADPMRFNNAKQNRSFMLNYNSFCEEFLSAYADCSNINDMLLSFNQKENFIPKVKSPIYDQFRAGGFRAVMTSSQAKDFVDKKAISAFTKDSDLARQIYYREIRGVKQLRHSFKCLVELCAPYMQSNNVAIELFTEFKNFSAYELIFVSQH